MGSAKFCIPLETFRPISSLHHDKGASASSFHILSTVAIYLKYAKNGPPLFSFMALGFMGRPIAGESLLCRVPFNTQFPHPGSKGGPVDARGLGSPGDIPIMFF
jgi:hypothetical protein